MNITRRVRAINKTVRKRAHPEPASLAAALLLFCLAGGAQAATYYAAKTGLDTNAGSLAAPFLTVGKGVSVLKAGDTLIVKAGVYSESLLNSIPSGTSWTSPVTVKANTGDVVTLQPPAGSARVIYLDSRPDQSPTVKQYIILDGFIFDGAHITYDVIKITQGSNHIRIQNCEIKNGPTQGILLSTAGTEYNEFLNLNVHNNGSDVGLDHGFYVSTAHNLIDGCQVHDNASYGIQIYSGSLGADYNTVRNSTCYNQPNKSGIILSSGTGNLAYNNVCYNNGNEGIRVAYNVTNALVLNNTCVGNGANGVLIQAGSNGAVVENNILWQNPQGAISNSGVGTTMDHNLTASDPLFVNAAARDYHIKAGSPAIDAGVALAQAPADKDGVVRPQSAAYDLGAYERVGGMGIYYVAKTGLDTNPGTLAAPFLTVTKGVSVLSPGDALFIEQGVYAEAINNTVIAGTGVSNPTAINAYSGQVVTLQPPAGPANVAAFSGAGSHNIVIAGLVLDGAYVTAEAVKVSGGANNILLQGCTVLNAPGGGISLDGNANSARKCRVHHNTGIGINIITGSTPVVCNNLVYLNTGHGIQASANYTQVYQNTCYQNGGAGISLPAAGYRVEANNDICWQNTGGDAITAAGDRPRIFNNVLGTDPKFANAAAFDFHLLAGSPAIDAGMPYPAAADDLDGLARPQGVKWDAGAYEYPQVQGITVGAFLVERPTLQCIGFQWYVTGDENHNATLTVQYRESGTTPWLNASNALRINKEVISSSNWVAANMFAGSVLDLKVDTSYDVLLTMADPDGGPGNGATQQFTSRTRAEPRAAAGGVQRHVYPAGYPGVKATPNYADVQLAYNACSAGDIVIVHAGNYQKDLVFNKKATAAQPIVIRGAGDGEAKLEGVGTPLIQAAGSAYLILEDLTLWDSSILVQARGGVVGLTVRRCNLNTTDYCGIDGLDFTNKDFLIADNTFTGPVTQWTPHGSLGSHAVWLQGQGHVACYNRVDQWWDGIDLAGGLPPTDLSQQNCAADFYGNNMSRCMDDCFELDYGVHNLRCFRNLMWNTFDGVSVQPIYGGPAYIFRNVLFNYTRTPVKFDEFPAGVMVYNNTFVSATKAGALANGWSNCRILNNLFVGKDGADNVISFGTKTPETTRIDYNGWRWAAITGTWAIYDSFGYAQASPAGGYWGMEGSFASLAQLTQYTGFEAHGIQTVDYNSFVSCPIPTGADGDFPAMDLHLPAGSVAIDKGTPLPNITDGYLGAAPDLGAYEGTQPAPWYGPRSYSITATASAYGSISPAGSVSAGHMSSSPPFAIAANPGCHITDVLVDGVSVGAVTSYTFNDVIANHTIAAGFAINTFTITASADPNGSIAPSGQVIVNYNASQTFTILPNTGCHLADVLVDGVSAGAVASWTFDSVTDNHTISASFAVNTYTISASAGPNGSITPSGQVAVNYNGTQAFTISPDTGYHVADVLVDGVSAGAVASYTFNSVADNHTISASFAINTFIITASADLDGSITPSGPVAVNYNGSQGFTISASIGYHVADVLVDGSSIGAATGYTFNNVVANHTISASFAINAFTIAASAGTNGSITPSGQVAVDYNGSRTFTILPDTGYHVADVLADGVSVGAVTSYTFNNVIANHTISAGFAINAYTITASADLNGTIAPSGPVTVDYNGSSSFAVSPDAGYHVADVLVDGISVGAVVSYTFSSVQADHTISASFAINTFTLSASAGLNGSIAPSGQVAVDYYGSWTFTISPDAGYHIVDVLVDGNSVGAVTSYTFNNVTANHTISATFAINTFTITASAGANGTITPSGRLAVNYNGTRAFTISPDAGYHVADVLVDGSSVGAVTDYTFDHVKADHTISASFAVNTFIIAASAGPNGSIAPAGQVAVSYNASQAFTISANAGCYVLDVLVDGSSVGAVASYTFDNVTADHTISASFALSSFIITASAGANGTIAPSGQIAVNYNGSQGFAISANTGYHVLDVLVDGSSVGAVASYTFNNVIANHTISASFTINTFTITASVGSNGAITPSGLVAVNYNGSQGFAISANTGYHVLSVLVDGSSVGAVASYTFNNVTANHTISATFAINTYTITASAGANGTITPSGPVTVNYNASRAFAISANTGYHVLNVLVDGSSVGAVASYTFNNVTANHTISATFAINTYTITASAGANGTITPSGPVTVNYNASQAFAISANTGYHVLNVLVDGSSVGAVASYTFNSVTANHTISATFSVNTYTITASAGANGTITPSGLVAVNYNASQAFAISANTGYRILDVLVDGSSVGAATSYTFNNVVANHTIAATFAVNTPAPPGNMVLWLKADAGVTKDAGYRVALWKDQGSFHNDAMQTNTSAEPLWKSSVLNGLPSIRFDGANDEMLFANSAMINTGGPFTQKTLALVFRTGSSVTSNQVLYQEGDSNRGLNIYLWQDGRIFVNAWNMVNDDRGATTPWGPKYLGSSAALKTNTPYYVVLIFNQTNGTLTGYLNSASLGQVAGVGKLFAHPRAALGAVDGGTRYHGGTWNNARCFSGDLIEAFYYNSALSDLDRQSLASYIQARYGLR